jgi:hypothetical protein
MRPLQDALVMWVPRDALRVMIVAYRETTLHTTLERRGAAVSVVPAHDVMSSAAPLAPAISAPFDAVIILGDPLGAEGTLGLAQLARAYVSVLRRSVDVLRQDGCLIIAEDTMWVREPRVSRAQWMAWRALRHLIVSRHVRSLPVRFVDRVDVFPDLWRPVFLLSRNAPAMLKRLTLSHAGHTRWRKLIPFGFPSNHVHVAERFAGGALHVGIKS